MYLILDTETNSQHPGQIAQLSYILTDKQRTIYDQGNYFFAVEAMDPYAESIHGFSQETLAILSQGKTFADALDTLHPLLHNHILVAHNAQFDKKFIQYEYERLGESYDAQVWCSMKHFTPICKLPHPHNGGYKPPKLSELLHFFHINDEDINTLSGQLFGTQALSAHDARYDTTALYLIMKTYHQQYI